MDNEKPNERFQVMGLPPIQPRQWVIRDMDTVVLVTGQPGSLLRDGNDCVVYFKHERLANESAEVLNHRLHG